MTDGRTQLVGLIGWPVEHSLSPVMHNSAFQNLGLNWKYVALPVAPRDVTAAVKGLMALGFRGANVTVPHKQSVMSKMESLSQSAQALGAMNTMVIARTEEGATSARGHNTDVAGFLGALREAGLEPADTDKAVVVGAGGAARAAVYGLVDSGARQILILNRTAHRGEDVAADLTEHAQVGTHLLAESLTPETLIEACREATVLVNATSAGMWPNDHDSIWPDDVAVPPHLTVMDMVYAPLETQLLRHARQSGACVIDGLGMLVLQGALAFSMWTGISAVNDIVPIMREACESELNAR